MNIPVMQVSSYVKLQRECVAPTDGRMLVRAGQYLNSGDPILEFIESPQIALLDLKQGLGALADRIEGTLDLEPGDRVEAGDLLAGPVGLTRRVIRSPINARFVQIQHHKIMLEKDASSKTLRTLYPGIVVHLIENRGVVTEATGAIVQGIWGNGRNTTAILHAAKPETNPSDWSAGLADQAADKVLYIHACMEYGSLQKLISMNLRGLIMGYLAPELIPATSKTQFPVLVTSGFMDRGGPPHIIEILSSHHGAQVILNARTWDPLSNLRPEVFIPTSTQEQPEPEIQSILLAPGTPVLIINGPDNGKRGVFEGVQGKITLANYQVVEMGKVRLSNDEIRISPLLNLVATP